MLTIDDKGGTCCAWCSEPASLTGLRFAPLSSKRPIASLEQLRASQPYRSAIDSWRAGRVR